MEARQLRWAVMLAALLLVGVGSGYAQVGSGYAQKEEPPEGTIRLDEIASYTGEKVTVEGTASRRIDDEAETTNLYEFVDYFNAAITVRTTEDYPVKGKRYRITGTVVEAGPEMWYLVESPGTRVAVGEAPPPEVAPEVAVSPPPVLPWWKQLSPLMIGLIAATGVVFIALVVVLIKLLTARPEVEVVTTEGTTVKLHTPPESELQAGTIKVLPGRFEFIAGEDSVPEFRCFVSADNPQREFLLGRVAEGTQVPLNQIGFAHQTVSRNQAKLIYSDGKYTIINYADPATRNATQVNGEALALNGSRELHEGDVVTVGVVKFKYHVE